MIFEDKSIVLVMEEPEKEKLKEYSKRRVKLKTDPSFDEIVRECLIFALTHYDDFLKEYESLEPIRLINLLEGHFNIDNRFYPSQKSFASKGTTKSLV